jgi:hypothetical protein
VDVSGINYSIFLNYGVNITALAGYFVGQDSNSSTIYNLALINGRNSDQISGLPSGFNHDLVFLSLVVAGTILFAGGTVRGNIDRQDIGGILAFDFVNQILVPTQLTPLTGVDPTVKVMSIPYDRELVDVYVGGLFEKAGGKDCPIVCIYNVDTLSWRQAGIGLTGIASVMTWIGSKTLVVGGNLTLNGRPLYMAVYYLPTGQWIPFNSQVLIPGPITAMTPASSLIGYSSSGPWTSDSMAFWVAGYSAEGFAYLMKCSQGNCSSAPGDLGNTTHVRDLQVFSILGSHQASPLLSRNDVLILAGRLDLPGYGSASAAYFNGSAYIPFILTKTRFNKPGNLAQVFVLVDEFQKDYGPKNPAGMVIGISVAVIAMLLVIPAIGEVHAHLRRRREGYLRVSLQVPNESSG